MVINDKQFLTYLNIRNIPWYKYRRYFYHGRKGSIARNVKLVLDVKLSVVTKLVLDVKDWERQYSVAEEVVFMNTF